MDGLRVGGLSAIARAAGRHLAGRGGQRGGDPGAGLPARLRGGEDGVASPAGKTAARCRWRRSRSPGFTGKNFDGEGIALEPAGGCSSRRRSSPRSANSPGRQAPAHPAGARPLPGRPRAGASGATWASRASPSSPGATALWTANERALQQDAPDDPARPSPVRLLRYERRGGGFVARRPSTSTWWRHRRPAGRGLPGPRPGRSCWPCRGGGDCWPWSGSTSRGGASRSSSSGSRSPAPPTSRGSESLAGRSWTPVRKTLVYDFARAGFVPDNLEGMAPRTAAARRLAHAGRW